MGVGLVAKAGLMCPRGLPLCPPVPLMMPKLLSLMPWLMVLKISLPIVVLGTTLQFIAWNYLEEVGGGRMCPHVPIAPCHSIINPPIPMGPCPTLTLPSTYGSPLWSPSWSMVTSSSSLVPSLSLSLSLQPSPCGLDHLPVPSSCPTTMSSSL